MTSPWDPPLGVAALDRALNGGKEELNPLPGETEEQRIERLRGKAMRMLYDRSKRWEGVHPLVMTALRQSLFEFFERATPDWAEFQISILIYSRDEERPEEMVTDLLSTMDKEQTIEMMQHWIDLQEDTK